MLRTIFEPEHDQFRESARRFFQSEIGPHGERWRKQGFVDREAFLKAGEQGYLMIWADEKYGGANIKDFRFEQILIEENGLHGGNAYRDAHRAEIAKHILAIESDSGVFRPEGFGLAASAPLQVRANMMEIATLLSGIGADQIAANGGGADIGPMMREGVIGASLDVDGAHYFDIHHTHADTFDKINPRELALCVATMAVMAYVVADLPEPLYHR